MTPLNQTLAAITGLSDPLHEADGLQPEDVIAQDTAVDHAQATERGRRCLLLADSLVSALNARGLLRASRVECVKEMFHIIADDLYGNRAVDIPRFDR